jgi:pectate disaccharide-lyase
VISEPHSRRARATLRRVAHPDRRRAALWTALGIAVLAGLLVGVELASRSSSGSNGAPAVDAARPSEVQWPSSAGAARRGATRYVSPAGSDDNPGSRSRPWRTIEHAAARIRPGGLVKVAPGRYRGPLTIATSGTAARPVRFVSQRRWRARITARDSGPIAVVALQGDHVSFEGFDVTGSGGDGTAGIHVEGSNAAVVGNYVHDVRVPCLDTGNGGAGIVVGGGADGYRNRDGLVGDNVVMDIGSGPRNGSCRLVHGIYAGVPRVTIANNIVVDAAGDGITSWHAARALTIANNLSAMNGGAGILIGSGDAGATRAGHRDTLVSNNIVYRNELYGITESSDGAHRVGPGNRYMNNLHFANRDGDTRASSGIGGLHSGAAESDNIHADPRFVASMTAGVRRAYLLEATSPAVDAGTCAGAPPRDFTGAARRQGQSVDIGPRELRSTPQRCGG